MKWASSGRALRIYMGCICGVVKNVQNPQHHDKNQSQATQYGVVHNWHEHDGKNGINQQRRKSEAWEPERGIEATKPWEKERPGAEGMQPACVGWYGVIFNESPPTGASL